MAAVDRGVMDLLSQLAPAPPLADVPVEQLRNSMRDAIALFTRGVAPIPVARVVDVVLPGHGGQVPVRLYAPEDPVAVMVYLHGGGWALGDIETHDLVARRMSRDTRAVVVSVGYRLVPERPYPAALDDVHDALSWAHGSYPELPLLVAGDSAGGTLAACVALRSRDTDGPRIDAQVLVYPVVDDDVTTPSMVEFRDGPRLTADDVRFYCDLYASGEETRDSPYVLPGRATSLAGLPPTVIVIAGHDPLRSSEEDYARRLEQAGVQVVVQFDPELVHGWLDIAGRVPAADRAFTRLTEQIGRLLDLVDAR